MDINQLELELESIYNQIVKSEKKAESISAKVHPNYRLSSKNLYRYLILRSYDLRKVHDSLSDLGISSLRTSEGYVYRNVSNVLKIIKLFRGESWEDIAPVEAIGYQQSKELLQKHANNLFNEIVREEHFTEIMVTLPDEAGEDVDLIRNLVKEGMEIARINLSHGDLDLWRKIVDNINQVKDELNVPVKIYMDLAGPKIRTADIEISKGKKKAKKFIELKEGEHLVLTKRFTKGKKSKYGKDNKILEYAEVGVLLPQIIDDIRVGDSVYFDDGMIKASVVSKTSEDVELIIERAFKLKLAGNKGINLPDTHLKLPSLTDRDIELLPFICKNADIVGYSFVRNAQDVEKLYSELEKNKDKDIGIVFKIENIEAFQNLPLILFEAMKRDKIGVMIARGDLAVEIGFERISEVQNQIMWICEAAHVPVIWATQVLENLAKTGIATRAEISDAAVSAQAECVMLNKGPYVVDAVRTLKSIISKMESHAFKKKSTLRILKVATVTLEKIESTNR